MKWFEATIGRRLLVRIWAHGVLLFAGVIAIVMAARVLYAEIDTHFLMKHHPATANAIATSVLAASDDPATLRASLAALHRDLALDITVWGADGALLGTTIEPALVAPADAARDEAGTWRGDRWIVGRPARGRAATSVVVQIPRPPNMSLHVLALLTAALVLALLFVAAPLTRSIARPIERLGRLARELGGGNLAVRAAVDRRDEIGDLARSFNAMAERIVHLRATERALLGDVSHELRTPLARMRVVLELAEGAEPEKARRYLAEINADLGELEQLVDDIIVSARLDPESSRWEDAKPPLRRRRVSIAEPVDAAIARFSARFPERSLAYAPSEDPPLVDVDPALLRRVVDNLLDNARKYSSEETAIEIRISSTPTSVKVDVIDHGIGIGLEDQKRVFSTFFRADRSRTRASGGVGLGLPLARRIVEAHGGTIHFTSELEHGSHFWFELPR
ncbi:MAG TPA: HAMP domain-containing sensor histidine kinase [Kofleriaceae bacterium]|jgi:signal transduction histidine kinase